MKKQIISTTKAPAAIGPYSQAIKVGNLVFTSGQLPIDPATGEVVRGDVKKATERTLENVKAILEEAGTCLDNVIKATIFVKDMSDFEAVNEVYARYFQKDMPARACVQAIQAKDSLVEIEVIAFVE